MTVTATANVTVSAPTAGHRTKSGWRDYSELAKPGITALIVSVAVAGFFLASPASFNPVSLGVLVATGTMASAGSAMLNHYLDRDLDLHMRRTRHRALPSARIGPGYAVAVAGLALVGSGVGIASAWLNPLTGFSILLGAITYVVVYTWWLKRRSSWNIVIGGFAGSAPALAGGAAAVGAWTPSVLALGLLLFLWTPPHFWSLAMVLREDYRAAALPMLPRMDDPVRSGRTIVVSAALLVPATALLIALAPVTLWAAVALLALVGAFVLLVAPLWRAPDRRVARRAFGYSGVYLLGVIAITITNWAVLAKGATPWF